MTLCFTEKYFLFFLIFTSSYSNSVGLLFSNKVNLFLIVNLKNFFLDLFKYYQKINFV